MTSVVVPSSQQTIDVRTLGIGHHARLWAETLFEPDDILEFRVLPPKQLIKDLQPSKFIASIFRRRHRIPWWIEAADINGLLGKLHELNHIDGIPIPCGYYKKSTGKWRKVRWIDEIQLNIYCSANPRKQRGGTRNSDIALARSIFADCDNTPIEVACQRAINAGLPAATMTVDSGHGAHLYWRLSEPITDLKLWTDLQKRLSQSLGSDPSIHDPARMTRLPGFQNVNWTPRLCHIVEVDSSRRCSIEDLHACLPPLAASKPDQPKPSPRPQSQVKLDLACRDEPMNRALAYQAQFSPAKAGARNTKLFDLAANLVEKFDLDGDELLQVAATYNDRFEEPLDRKELNEVVENACRHIYRKGVERGRLLAEEGSSVVPAKADGQPVPLEEWQQQMRQARLESLNRSGTVNFDGSATGAGKSTADLVAMREAGRSITFLPTHGGCAELAESLNQQDLCCAAFPPLDASTCQRFGTKNQPGDAQLVQLGGLDVGVTLCPECPHFKDCEYQRRRETARNIDHAVATHARASHSVFAPAEDRPIVFVHEDARSLLRPMTIVTSGATKKTGLVPQIQDLKNVFEVARAARDIAVEWGDEEKKDFAVRVALAAKTLITELQDREMVQSVEAADANGTTAEAPRVRLIPAPTPTERPDRSDYLLYRASLRLGINPHGDALRLVTGFACGDMESLCAVVDDAYVKNGNGKGKRTFFKSLVGVWRVQPPDGPVIWFEDATGDRDLLEKFLQRPVVNRTPAGHLEYSVPPVQYVLPKQSDITMQTSGNIVRGIVRGLLAVLPDRNTVGIITHRTHLTALQQLEDYWAQRIIKMDYYRSGNDRGSNNWLNCDLIIIMGTPRVPPSAVRHGLIQIGEIEAAAKDGHWSKQNWIGVTEDGKERQVPGLGYQEPNWAKVHKILVRDTLQQAIGRGRGVMEAGVPVVVVSNEPLGVPLASEDLVELKDSVAKTYACIRALTDKSPKYTTLEKMSVTTLDIAELTHQSEKQSLRHCTTLSNLRLLARKGARGGWYLPETPKTSI